MYWHLVDTIMTAKTISLCARYGHPAQCDTLMGGDISRYRENSGPCDSIIDAEESNKALQMVSKIRRKNRHSSRGTVSIPAW
ncbi:MAG: hypothetical protein Q7T80_04570, partial [Methanoregula sp.]|nr:hypothetical protein [Methanoregula sp.]